LLKQLFPVCYSTCCSWRQYR